MRNLFYELESLIVRSNEVESDEERDLIYAQIEQLEFERSDTLDALADLMLQTEAKIEQQKLLMDARKATVLHTERAIEFLLRGKPLTTVEHEFKYRKSTAVNITNANMLPESYRRVVPATWNPDKIAIGKSLKAGEEIPGAILEERQNLSIK